MLAFLSSPLFLRERNNFDRVAFPECVSSPLKLISDTYAESVLSCQIRRFGSLNRNTCFADLQIYPVVLVAIFLHY